MQLVKKPKIDVKIVFDGSLTNSSGDSGPNSGKEEHTVFRFFDDEKKQEEEIPGVTYINGTFWDKFQKMKKLGEGTSGIVRKCIRNEDGMEFAVKIVRTRDDEIIFHVRELCLTRRSKTNSRT